LEGSEGLLFSDILQGSVAGATILHGRHLSQNTCQKLGSQTEDLRTHSLGDLTCVQSAEKASVVGQDLQQVELTVRDGGVVAVIYDNSQQSNFSFTPEIFCKSRILIPANYDLFMDKMPCCCNPIRILVQFTRMFDNALRNRGNEAAAVKLSGTFETRQLKANSIRFLTSF
jgi:hypothetical protein